MRAICSEVEWAAYNLDKRKVVLSLLKKEMSEQEAREALQIIEEIHDMAEVKMVKLNTPRSNSIDDIIERIDKWQP